MKQKFAFFDFDDTLIHGDSGKALLWYYLKKHPLAVFRLLKVPVLYFLYLIGLVKFQIVKSSWLFPMDRLDDDELNDFYQVCLVPKYYPNVVAELKNKKQQGYLIFICSASIEGYLRFCELPVDGILGTKTEIKNGKYTSKMIGKNCKNEEKVLRLNNIINKLNLEIDYENSYAYSDSVHDIPMLKMVKNRIKINKKNGEMTPFIIEE
ncbi:HAD family hydrolase [Thomasclavelia cocleata]|uniref:HAD family hydrolase n=3 Tax=Thomasclavelia cocleata TaxID=69824 RepID=UPI0024314363|nr:HAD family hydrolase [Thomasclavelia cocleata]